jgi:2-polyprenyl-3-methyl-5-hydroxy-6-metoxy-1,4-benzoquinol methylase
VCTPCGLLLRDYHAGVHNRSESEKNNFMQLRNNPSGQPVASREHERWRSVRMSYDTIAAEYARRIYAELKDKPFDREWLDGFAERVRAIGQVCDLGCGPGHVARYLRDRGVHVFGLDLSPVMLVLCLINNLTIKGRGLYLPYHVGCGRSAPHFR